MVFDKLIFEVDNQEEFDRDILALARALERAQVAFPAIEKMFREKMRAHFDSRGGKAGGWLPLSLAYSRRKAVTHPGQPIMHRDDVLYKSLTEQGAPFGIRDIGASHMTLGTFRPGAKAHHVGVPRIGLPERRVIALETADYLEMTLEIVRTLTRLAREIGFDTEVGLAV